MLKFDFLKKGLGIVSLPQFAYNFLENMLLMLYSIKCFSCYILLTDQISLSDCICFLLYLAICVFQLFVSQFCGVKNF